MSLHQLVSAVQVRPIVFARQGGHCACCWEPLPSRWEAHHRQRRRDSAAGWCPCNVVGLHPRCHTQGPGRPGAGQWAVHDHPDAARQLGLIVPSWAEDPGTVPVTVAWPWAGPALLAHDGMVVSTLAATP